MSEEALRALLQAMGVEVRHKSTSWVMRAIGVVLGCFGLDFDRFWTTIHGRTIYAPDRVNLERLSPYQSVIRHELVHIEQARRWPGLFQLSYLLAPVPFGFAWCRWRWEREAYLVDLRSGRLSLEEVLDTLWRNYGWCWPKPWMRRWFEKALRERSP